MCALYKDIKQQEYGGRSLFREYGVSLSVAQKARVDLACALYRSIDIYLPARRPSTLSGVDNHVGRVLFDDCIARYLGSTLSAY